MTADCLKTRQIAEIIGLDENDIALRLGEMGFWPGRSLELLTSAPFGDPMAFRLDRSIIALRKDEAKLIRVKPLSTAA